MRADSRGRMIDAASRLLAERGYEATSFSSVLKLSGAPRGSIYHHFPGGKDDLVAAALAAQAERSLHALDSLAGMSAGDVVDGYVDLWRTLLRRTDFAVGCSLTGVTVAGSPPELQHDAAEVWAAWVSRLTDVLRRGGMRHGAERLATTLVAACQGAVVMARAMRSLAPLDAVADQLRSDAAR